MSKNYLDDAYMVYDLKDHRYTLTAEAVSHYYNFDLSQELSDASDIDSDASAAVYLSRISLEVYNYIYSYNYKYVMEYLASLPAHRDAIERAMLEEVFSELVTNDEPGITTNSINGYMGLCPNAITILRNDGLLYRGKYIKLPVNWQDGRGVDY